MASPRPSRHRVGAGLVALLALGLCLGALGSSDSPPPPLAGTVQPWAPLAGTEPAPTGERPVADLVRLSRWLGEPEILGLGEDPHGTHTLHRLAHRIFEHLVRFERFETFALEIDQAHASLLDDYAQGRRDDLEELLAGGWWGQRIFYDEALAELLRWMRRYNETADRPLRVAGFDAKQPQLAAERLLEILAAADPQVVPKARELVARALAPGGFGMFPNVQGFTGSTRIALPADRSSGAMALELTIRGEAVTYGTAGFWIRTEAAETPSPVSISSAELDPEGSVRALELAVPDTAESVELTVFHRGDGAVRFEAPSILLGSQRLPLHGIFAAIEPRPLMMPALQHMDYRAEPIGQDGLRIAADPLLADSLEAARGLQGLVDEIVVAKDVEAGEDGAERRVVWARQLARLVTQAVEWRVLAEPNRDVFLAENLLWLHRTGLPGGRILAFGHRSHTERRPGRMGDLMAEELGESYRTVSMIAGSGSYRYFGAVSAIREDSALELFEVDPSAPDLRAALAALHPGSFLVPSWAYPPVGPESRVGSEVGSLPEAILFVRGVEPLKDAH